VDYPKSGQPVALNAIPRLRFKRKPDWNAPETLSPDSAGKYVKSQRAIGRLFRAIDLPPVQTKPQLSRIQRRMIMEGHGLDVDELVDTFSDFALSDAGDDPVFSAVQHHVHGFISTTSIPSRETTDNIALIFGRYSSQLQGICAANTLSHSQFAMLSEEEAIIGTIAQKTSQPRKRKELMAKLREQTDWLVKGIREEFAGDDESTHEEHLERAWLSYKLAMAERQTFGATSFAFVALGGIFEAIKEIEDADKEESRSRHL